MVQKWVKNGKFGSVMEFDGYVSNHTYMVDLAYGLNSVLFLLSQWMVVKRQEVRKGSADYHCVPMYCIDFINPLIDAVFALYL